MDKDIKDMSKEEAEQFMNNLLTLSLVKQLRIFKKVSKNTMDGLTEEEISWIYSGTLEQKSKAYKKINKNNPLIKTLQYQEWCRILNYYMDKFDPNSEPDLGLSNLLDDDNISDEQIEAYLILKKIIE